MSEPKKQPPSNPSRTLAIIAVAVLIVVAIAGIVIAGRKAPAPPETSATAVPAPAPTTAAATSAPPASTAEAAASPTEQLPREVVFMPGSDKLPSGANEPLARFADAARTSASSVRLSARYLTGKNKDKDLDLAKARTGAIRHALQANGVNGGKMQVELIEMPEGSLTPEAGNRVDLTLR